MKLSKYIVTGALTTLTILSGFVESADAQRAAQKYSGEADVSTLGNEDMTNVSFAIFEDVIEDSSSEGQALIAEGQALIAEGPALIAEGPALIAEGQALIDRGPALIAEGQALIAEGQALIAEGQALIDRGPALMAERQALIDPGQDLREQIQALKNRGQALKNRGQDLIAEGQVLKNRGQDLIAEGQALIAEGQDLKDRGQELQDRNSLFVGAVPFYSEFFYFAINDPDDPTTDKTEYQNLDLLVERVDDWVKYNFQNEQGETVFYSEGTFSNNDILAATNDLSFIAKNFPWNIDILVEILTFTSNNHPSSSFCSSTSCFSTSQNSITIPDSSTPPPQSVPEPNSISAIFVLSILSYGLWNKAKKRSF